MRIHALPPAHTPAKVRISFDSVGYMTIGVQLVGPRDGDARLLRTARWLAAPGGGGIEVGDQKSEVGH